MDKKKYASNIFWAAILYISLICLDQFSKVFAKEHLSNKKPFVIIKDVFEFNYLELTPPPRGTSGGGCRSDRTGSRCRGTSGRAAHALCCRALA